MYEITCPYCKHDNSLWEVDGGVNKYIPHFCEECEGIFWIMQRSWFDPYYDNTNVEIRNKKWVEGNLKRLEIAGDMKNEEGEIVAHIYRPKWDLYEAHGGQEKVRKEIEELWGK